LRKSLILYTLLMLSISACTGSAQNPLPLQDTSPTAMASPTPDLPSTAEQSKLDLREANVIAASIEVLENNDYRFDVTLQHDDEGEAPSYADYWQVEDLNGNILGKRVLTHSHGNEPFTRSKIIPIPDDIAILIVRGHDMMHGFGGQAIRINLSTGETETFFENDGWD
jgi:hypothetical protein